MSRQKRIFLVLAIVFFLAMFWVAYDISRRTTFPGSKPQLRERIQKEFIDEDSTTTEKDSVIQR